ncbi:thioesterase thiol ester dehydrase-isomerase [Coniophora puteana RWD-64-598 SS2]|uniref:Thioesterase thiol ester dehydrase-isomerase n=1 Tax=Coniophora puteana (strain RWD-64-598) TaxID=741705 RepID=A0A5M3MHC5_CONPW|nr:thioesterase thiol ester dehydrase-isomerase [Coniophora puteana RWD-64-598 SS2]EIW78612.1 thioesterase thiol ester dehydrase-isomerase [Coniophora puteana RWD-64-598 SS2]
MFSSRLRTLPAHLPRRVPKASTARAYSQSASSSSSARPSSLRTLALATGVGLTFYTLGALFPPRVALLVSPRPAAPLPGADTTEGQAYTAELEASLQSLPTLVEHRSREDAEEWYETRPYATMPDERKVNSLTAGSLKGPGKLALAPLVRVRVDESETFAILHLGRALCGHDGVIHGGLLATILDESLARVAISNLPDKIGVTANLAINYKAPTFADQFVVIKVNLVEKKGRKTQVTGGVEDLKGNLLVEAAATFVQPKYAHLLSNSAVRQAMGEPVKVPTASREAGKEPILLGEGKAVPPALPAVNKKI